jgi:hypothetical protein
MGTRQNTDRSRVYRGEPALNCRAWITFYHLDSHRIFEREMIGQ